jgi:hypothetical protein
MSQKKNKKIKVIWEYVEDPEALEKLKRALEIILGDIPEDKRSQRREGEVGNQRER